MVDEKREMRFFHSLTLSVISHWIEARYYCRFYKQLFNCLESAESENFATISARSVLANKKNCFEKVLSALYIHRWKIKFTAITQCNRSYSPPPLFEQYTYFYARKKQQKIYLKLFLFFATDTHFAIVPWEKAFIHANHHKRMVQ